MKRFALISVIVARIFTETCTQEGSTEIDPDGTGPVRSFQVMCSKGKQHGQTIHYIHR